MDMAILLTILEQQIQRLALKVNFMKSKMMNITQGTETLNAGNWYVERDREGTRDPRGVMPCGEGSWRGTQDPRGGDAMWRGIMESHPRP